MFRRLFSWKTVDDQVSITQLSNFAVIALGVVEMNMQLLQPLLGDWFGVAFIGVAIVNQMNRATTTKALKNVL